MTSVQSAASRRTRIITVIAATVIALACGTNYVYSAWAPQFAQRLQLSTTQANLIGTMGNLGMYATGVPVGMLVDSKGPRWGVSLGIVLFAGGYYPLAGAFDAGPGEYGILSLCLFSFFTGAGSSSAFSASIKAAAISWPEHRGTATAFPLAAFGLSAFFFSTVALAFPHDTSHFLLTLATGTVVLPIISWFFLRTPSNDKIVQLPSQESQRLHRTKPADRSDLHRRVLQRTAASKPNATSPAKATDPEDDEDVGDEQASLLSKSSSSSPSTPNSERASRPNTSHRSNDPTHHHDIRGVALLGHVEFYQLFSLLALMCGIGLMTINNIGNVAQALWKAYLPDVTDGYIAKRQVLHVSILSVCSFGGRLCSGIGSDILVRSFNRSRYWCVFASGCVFTAAQIAAVSLTNPNFLVLVSGLTGIAYGMLFGVYPSLVAHAFGVGGLSTNWGTMTLAPAISGNIFNLIYGAIYDSHSVEHDEGHSECLQGKNCYNAAYWMTFGSSLAAMLICLWTIRYENVLHQSREREKRRESNLPDEGGYGDSYRYAEAAARIE